ncbi:hypothetical protein GLAREA_09458 [Glarea lozoyensis ATCC 20868]|uniref:Uncharacterized protein n=1 Tax=Glarea lozoyensis (strain ATCC 20868 / MF5171) TaxID=1116229 RepID=S3DPH6_GLAL2|nr:uncharacterized protein GLAREA_09458 [Glarea lozoyensis ATCC 20868]EPE28338.1 hypothetical protein GLAREA_09458 [Glarea lozoyensis ATCC 20868]
MSPGIDTSQSRICGCWVEVLPTIVSNGESKDNVVPLAIKALYQSIIKKDRMGELDPDYTESYAAALARLRKALPDSHTSQYVGFAAASMCLTLSEVLFPTTTDGWRRHIQGISDLMQLIGPDVHRSGAAYKLFVGFRPLLVTEAFIARKATFVASQEWISIPFQFNTASPMQTLLSYATIIPSLLEKADFDTASPTTDDICAEFEQVLCTLLQWENTQVEVEFGNPYWAKAATSTTISSHGSSPSTLLWFPNILFANAFTHLWTFQIICLSEIARLRAGRTDTLLSTKSSLPSEIMNEDYVFKLSTKICQSMEYQLQDEMKLYGPASVLFPLRIARATFDSDPARHQKEISWCDEFVDQLRSKGIHLAP